MIGGRDAATIVGAASVAEVGAYLALDSTLASLAAFGSVVGLGVLHLRARKAKLGSGPAAAPLDAAAADQAPADPPRAAAPSSLSPVRSAPRATTEFEELIPMPAPAPQPRRDETFIAVADLCTRIDGLQRSLDADSGVPQRLDAIRQTLRETLDAAEFRSERTNEESAMRAQRLAEACKAIEARIESTESRLLGSEKRLERTLADSSERAAERNKESFTRFVRELANLRDDVQRATSGLAEMQSGQRAPVALDAEHTRLVASAAENASGMARRVGALSDRLDAGIGRLEELGARGHAQSEEGVRAIRAAMVALARDAAELQLHSRSLQDGIADSEARIARAVHDAGSRLDGSMRELRALVEAIPAPEAPREVDLAPFMSALAAAETRIADDLRALEANLRPRAPDLSPVTNAVIASEERLVEKLRSVEASLRPRATDLSPVLDAMQSARSEFATLLGAAKQAVEASRAPPIDLAPVHAALAAAEARLHERLDVRLDTLEGHVAALPAPETIDLAPLRSGVAEIAENLEVALRGLDRIEPVERPLRDAERRLGARIDAVAELVADLPVPEPTDLSPFEAEVRALGVRIAHLDAAIARIPTPTAVDLAPLEARLSSLAERIEPVALPLRDTEHRLRAKMDEVASAVARIPAPAPLAPLEQGIGALAARVETLAASAEPVAMPLREAEQRIGARIDALAHAIDHLPAPATADLAPLRESIGALSDSLATRIEPVARPLREAEQRLTGRIDALAHAIEAAPAPRVELAPLREGLAALAQRIEPVARPLRDAEERLTARVDAVQQSIAAIPAPKPVDLAPMASSLVALGDQLDRRTDTILGHIDAVADEVIERMPTPERVDLAPIHARLDALRAAIVAFDIEAPEFPTDEITRTIRDSGSRIGESVRDLREEILASLQARPHVDLAPVVASIREVEAQLLARWNAASANERAARRDETQKLDAELSAIRDAIASIPRAAPFPLDEITGALSHAEERILRRMSAASDVDRVAWRDEGARIEAALTVLADAISAIPRPERAPAFPLEEIAGAVRETEERLARRVHAGADDARAAQREDNARIHSALAGLAAAIDALPAPERAAPFPIAEIHEGFLSAIRAIPRPEAPPPFPLDEIVRGVRESEERLAKRMRESVAAIPAPLAPVPFPMDEVQAGFTAVREAIRAIPRPEAPPAFPLHEIASTVQQAEERIGKRLRESIAAIPAPIAPVPFPLDEITGAVQQAEDRIAKRLREGIAAIPAPIAPAPFPLDEITGAVQQAEERIAKRIRESVAAIPAPPMPPAFPLAEIASGLRETEERLAKRIREGIAAIPQPETPAPFPLDEIAGHVHVSEERLVKKLAAVQHAVESLPPHPEPPAFPIGEIHGAIETVTAAQATRIGALQRELNSAIANMREENAAAWRNMGERLLSAPMDAAAPLAEKADKIHTAIEAFSAEVRRELDERSASANEISVHILDAMEDLRADVDARHRRVESLFAGQPDALARGVAGAMGEMRDAINGSRGDAEGYAEASIARMDKLTRELDARMQALQSATETGATQRDASAKALMRTFQSTMLDALDATTRRMDERLAKAEARLDAALAGMAREDPAQDLALALDARDEQMERRLSQRIASLEQRLVDEMRSASARLHAEAAPLVPHVPRPHRHLPRRAVE